MQLVTDKVIMYDTMKDRRIGIPEVIEKFGVPPEKVVEVQALAGDSTDNVPGVPGIGIKTAAQLIVEYGDLEQLLFRAGEIKQPKRREALIENAEKRGSRGNWCCWMTRSTLKCRSTTLRCTSRMRAS
jgi:DNA polymerase-1